MLPTLNIAYFPFYLLCLFLQGSKKEGTCLSVLTVWVTRSMPGMVRLSPTCLLFPQSFPCGKHLGARNEGLIPESGSLSQQSCLGGMMSSIIS